MSAKTSKPATHHDIIKAVKSKNFEKIYFLHGEEPFFIDEITTAIINNVLDPSERDFNQSIYYGKECDPYNIMTEARSYPMLGERRLIVIKEAQEFTSKSNDKDIEALAPYFERPNESTVFVVAYKHKTYDARKKLIKLAKTNGIVFLSEKIRDYKIVDWIVQYAKQSGYQVAPKAAALLGESLGTDLSRIIKEFEKLSILFPKGTLITETHVEEHVGISKDYNFFELQNAFETADFLKASKIINYFEKNPKVGRPEPIISTLYNYHVKLLKIAYAKNKTDQQLASELHIAPYIFPRFRQTIDRYNKRKLARNIEILLEYDLKAKGVNNASSSPSDLMKEMMYRLMTA